MEQMELDLEVEEMPVAPAKRTPTRKTTEPVVISDEVLHYDGSDATTFRATQDPAELDEILPALEAAPIIAFDVETTGLDYKRDSLHGLALATADQEWYVCGMALQVLLPELAHLSQREDKLWLAHNAKFDCHFLLPHGFRPARMADTMIAQWLVNENMELGLKSLAHTRLGYPADLPEYKDLLHEAKKRLKKKKLEDVTIYEIPVHLLGEYSARDTRLTYKLWMKLVYDLDQEKQADVFWNIEMPFVWVLLEMENNGLPLDLPAVHQTQVEFEQEMADLLKQWNEMTGNVNPKSTKQLGDYLFKKLKLPQQGVTEKGAPKVDDLTLQRLEALDESGSVKVLRQYKKLEKIIGTYLIPFQEMAFEGRLYGGFNQTGTVTGRLSSSDPNLQNIPSRGPLGKKIRKAFGVGANSTQTLIVCDYSQIELRMLANESKDEHFLDIFMNGGDPHQMTADLAKVDRAVGKTINFGWGYGMGPRKLADTIEKAGQPRPNEADAKQWLNQFNQAYPTLVKWKDLVIRHAKRLGYVPTVGGRKRRLPDLNSYDRMMQGAAERQCVNARIQGSCADMLKWAMIQIMPWCQMYGVKLVAQVHDELVFECEESIAAEFLPIVQDIMESIYTKFDLHVPIIAEPGQGKSWAEAK